MTRRPLQRMDTHHGLGGMGREPVPRVNRDHRVSRVPGVAFAVEPKPTGHAQLGSGPTHPAEVMMRFYTHQHRFYCGIDLHTRTLSLCVVNDRGAIVCERTLPPQPDELLATLAPYRDGLVVACECLFA